MPKPVRDSDGEYPQELPFTVEQLSRGKQELQKRLDAPVWTASKAKIIKLYLDLFVKVTFRGTYIDAFAGHQYEAHQNYWAAKLVWETNPGSNRKRIDRFELFEKSPASFKRLREMAADIKADGRGCRFHKGDCNVLLPRMLEERPVKGPAFCLLDQRTTQCTWKLVETIAKHKVEGTKIEIFYFLMAKWKDRSLKNRDKKRDCELEAFWGREDYESLLNAHPDVIQQRFVDRFRDDLKYEFVRAYPIADRTPQSPGGAIHYYMIHASDHPDAPKFMVRAYNKTAGGYDPYSIQPTFQWLPEDQKEIESLYRKGNVVRRRS